MVFGKSVQLRRPRRRIHEFVLLLSGCWVAGIGMPAADVRGQHADVLVQQRDGAVVTGLADVDNGGFVVGAGQRVFSGQVLYLEADHLLATGPGFLSSAAPTGSPPAFALPAKQPVSFNVLPMSIGGQTASLFYWDGAEGNTVADVSFRPVPSDLQLVIDSGIRRTLVKADSGTVAGHVLDTTSASGTLHTHPTFDFSRSAAAPPDALYLFSLELLLPGLTKSEPVFLILGRENPYPFEVPPSPFFDFVNFWDVREAAAVDWVTQTLLNPQPALCGDLDSDRDVDSADLLSFIENWTGSLDAGAGQATFGQGDCDADGDVDSADLLGFISAWTGASQERAGESPLAAVPEPAGLPLLGVVLLWGWSRGRTVRP